MPPDSQLDRPIGARRVDLERIEQARRFLEQPRGLVAVACDADVDGLTSAVIVERALRAVGAEPRVLPAGRGEHVHRDRMRARIRSLVPAALVVLDMGSRPEPILPGVPTLVIDHHHAASGTPPGALVLQGAAWDPVPPTAVLAYLACRAIGDGGSDAWLAALGAAGDLGPAARGFAGLLGVRPSGPLWTRAVSLLNAARRAPEPDPAVALEVLRHAEGVRDITSGRLAGSATLERQLEAVRAETARCARVPPILSGDVALVRFASGAQVHPVVAIRWARRLRPRIVIAANDGYLPGRVNFAVRCDAPLDLVTWLRGLPFRPADPEAEYGNGHPRATGGSLTQPDFARLLDGLRLAARTDRDHAQA